MNPNTTCNNYQRGVPCLCGTCTQQRTQRTLPTMVYSPMPQPLPNERAAMDQMRGATHSVWDDARMNGTARRRLQNTGAGVNMTARQSLLPEVMAQSNQEPEAGPSGVNSGRAAAPTRRGAYKESKYGDEPPRSAYGPPFEFKQLVHGMPPHEMEARKAYNLQVSQAKKIYQRHKNNIAAKKSRERRLETIETLTAEVNSQTAIIERLQARQAELEQAVARAEWMQPENLRLHGTVVQLRRENEVLQRRLDDLGGRFAAGARIATAYAEGVPGPSGTNSQYGPGPESRAPGMPADQSEAGALAQHGGSSGVDAGGQEAEGGDDNNDIDLELLPEFDTPRHRGNTSDPNAYDFNSLYR